jgi:hypothetical protein
MSSENFSNSLSNGMATVGDYDPLLSSLSVDDLKLDGIPDFNMLNEIDHSSSSSSDSNDSFTTQGVTTSTKRKRRNRVRVSKKQKIWTDLDDKILLAHVKAHGTNKWKLATYALDGKFDHKSCCTHYWNKLDPNISEKSWSQNDVALLETVYEEYKSKGNKWVFIRNAYFPNRSANNVKNKWYCIKNKKIRDDKNTTRYPLLFTLK